MMQVPVTQMPQYQIQPQPNYNAVKIDINNPQVNAPGSQVPVQQPITAPMYAYPQAPIYEIPKQSIYSAPQETPKVNTPAAVQEVPAVPQPVIVQPSINQSPVVIPPAPPTPPTQQTPAAAEKSPEPTVEEASAQPVEIKEPEVSTPKIDLNEFIAKLTSPDYEVQAKSMEAIADIAQNSPEKATELLDVKIIDTLLGIMNKDSSKLEGPTPKQLEIREKIINGKTVTDAEKAEANQISSMEQAERNKQYAVYTVAILQKLYGSEIQKLDNTVVPLTELPGAAGIVEQIKTNPNPMVRAAGIDALSYIQQPEYKQDLTTLFNVAKNDQDTNVQQAVAKALEKLNQIPDVATKPAEETAKK